MAHDLDHGLHRSGQQENAPSIQASEAETQGVGEEGVREYASAHRPDY